MPLGTALNFKDVGAIHDFESLLHFLRDSLEWPVDRDTVLEDVTFDYTAGELNIAEKQSKRLTGGGVRQLQNLDPGQPWGIFLVEFNEPQVYVEALRQVLRGLVKRRTHDPSVPGWNQEDLLFICATRNYESFTFAHFRQEKDRLAILSRFGWNQGEAHVRTLCEFNLKNLAFPRDPTRHDEWRALWRSAFDVRRVTAEFFRKYEEVFRRVEGLIQGFDIGRGTAEQQQAAKERRRLFTQRLFNRMLFLAFVQKKGWLEIPGQEAAMPYLQALWEDYQQRSVELQENNFYNNRLQLLFLALNTPHGPDLNKINRGGMIGNRVGKVRYLNGGLFDRDSGDPADVRVPDEAIDDILHQLFKPYNFTIEESTPLDVQVAVDPEMLGKVFEKLVTGRKGSGSYYTPKSVVTFMCRESLKRVLGQEYAALIDRGDTEGIGVPRARAVLARLETLTVVDPACGSGAYLLGMLHELHTLNRLLDTRAHEADARTDYDRKLSIIQKNLFGVDIDPFAVNIARLRMWLSLAVEYEGDNPDPLPNLDFKIEAGDSLLAPDPTGGLQLELFRQQFLQDYRKAKAEFQNFHGGSGAKDDLKKKIDGFKKELAEDAQRGKKGAGPVRGFDWAVEFAEVWMAGPTDTTSAPSKGATGAKTGGFDIVLANPPYGATVEEGVRDLYFNRKTHGAQSNDSYGLFIARGLQLLRPGGTLCYIVSNTCRTIKSHKPLRKKLVEEGTVAHLLDLPRWIFDATVDTGILTLTRQKPPPNHTLTAGDLTAIRQEDWKTLEVNLEAVAAHGPDVQTLDYARYTYPQDLIGTFDNYSFFIASPKLYELMSDKRFERLGNIADVPHGISTGNNKKYVRTDPSVRGGYDEVEEWMKMSHSEMHRLTSIERTRGVNKDWKTLRGCFVPFDKGGESDAAEGWLPNYHAPTQYYINWAKGAVADMRKNPGSAWKNETYFFRPGLTFSISGAYAPTFRLNGEAVFEAKGSGIFSEAIEREVLLALLCSRFARFQFKTYVKHTVDTSGDDIREFRIPTLNDQESNRLTALVQQIITKQKVNPRYPYHLHEQKEIDALIYELYGLDENDIREVELWFCRRYERLARAQGLWAEVETKYALHLARCRTIRDKPPGYWNSHPVLQLIAQGEGPQIEFKETLEADIGIGQAHPGVLKSALKTVVAFLNTEGGNLLIGVSDKAEIKGLQKDIDLLGKKKNLDGFELKLQDLLHSRLDHRPLGEVEIELVPLLDGEVCWVRVQPLPRTKVAHLDGKEVYIRQGNRTIQLHEPDLTNWAIGRAGA